MDFNVETTWIIREKGTDNAFRSGHDEYSTTSIKGLFADLRREHGRCDSKVYVDNLEGASHQVGWVFVRNASDSKSHLVETWVNVRGEAEDSNPF